MASKYDYTKIDPIIKKNPNISFTDFKKECKVKITNWAFLARRKFIKGEPGYGRTEVETVKAKTDKPSVYSLAADSLITLKDGRNVTLEELIAEMYPHGKLHDQYRVVAEALLKDPLTTHNSMLNSDAITMSDSNFYGFRRRFTKIVGLKPKGKHGVTSAVPFTGIAKVNRKKSLLYQTIFDKEVNGSFNSKEMTLLQEFIEVLNQDKAMNLEIFEITKPRHFIEVRKFSR